MHAAASSLMNVASLKAYGELLQWLGVGAIDRCRMSLNKREGEIPKEIFTASSLNRKRPTNPS